MCSFNAINGVPGCANRYLETRSSSSEWGFDGFVESDYTAVAELRECPGVAPRAGRAGTATPRTAGTRRARRCGPAPTRRWCRTNFRDFGARLVASGQVRMRRIDDAVRRILRVKFRAGLFENPYVDVAAAPGKQLLPREPRRRPPGGRPLDGPARERGRRAAARPGQVDGGHRPAGRRPPRHARAVVGARRGRGRRLGASRGCSPRTRARRSRPAAR